AALRLKSVNGPGHFSLWRATDGGPAVSMATSDGVTEDDFVEILEGSHAHFNYGFTAAGRYEITFEAFGTLADGDEILSGDVTFYFTVNPGPTAVDDNYSVPSQGLLFGNVLFNDTAFTELSATIVSAPAHGTIALLPNGAFSYAASDT